MKKVFYIITLISFSRQILGQTNIVPNPSFEDTVLCPNAQSQINRAKFWSSFMYSPDYYNSCANIISPAQGTPSNVLGYQVPATGNAYGHCAAWSVGGVFREIIGGQLTQTMSIGTQYYVSMKVSLISNPVPCDKIGIKFSKVSFYFGSSSPIVINNFAHVYSTAIISDTLNWTTVSGTFVADSAYKYIMIGNFFDDANTDTIDVPGAYQTGFYIDDVCVSTSSLTCGIATTIKTNVKDENIKIYPNPANSFITVSNSSKKCTVSLINSFGQELYTNSLSKNIQINLKQFPDGLYFLYIYRDNKLTVEKVVVTH